jgi:glutathione S-transferase
MTYDVFLGDRSYSSWSLRGWLMFRKFDLPVRTSMVGLYTGTLRDDLSHLAPARQVPVMRAPDGMVVGDSLAMAETLHESHPGAGLYPDDRAARALCRWIVAEMHSSYASLRAACPMNLVHGWAEFAPGDDVRADLARIESLWTMARNRFGAGGPWLFGRYSLADVFHAPVAARIAGYDLPVSAAARAYVDQHLADQDFRQWRAMGETVRVTPAPYRIDAQERPWPGPTSPPGRAVATGPAVNATCPFSGEPVSHFMALDGHVFGFCNAFCRDKTAADPGAWPEFRAIHSPFVNPGDD